MKADLAVWVIFYVLGVGANWLMGIVSHHLYLLTVVYTVIMMLAAAYAGAMMYRGD